MELVGKLSPKALGWDRIAIATAVGKVAADGSQPVLLGRFVGVVTGLKPIENEKTGDVSYGLKGSFKAVSSVADANGVLKEVRSGVCYLPGGIQDIVEAAWLAASEKDEKKRASIQFAMDIYAIPAANAAGYTFKADNIVDAQAGDATDAIMVAAQGVKPMPGLPAPNAGAALTDQSGGEQQSETKPEEKETEKAKK